MDRGTDARNFLLGKVIPLRLGYVGVVNRSQEVYSDLADHCGIPQLAKKLNQLLVQHIKDVLPGLKARINSFLVSVAKEHASYGEVTESKWWWFVAAAEGVDRQLEYYEMRLRKAVILLLSVTVLAPIVLYTDTLGNYIKTTSPQSSSGIGNDIIAEEMSIFESIEQSGNTSSATDNARIKRQPAEEAMEKHDTILSSADRNTASQSGDGGKLIQKVTGTVFHAQQDRVNSKKSQSSGETEVEALPIDKSREISSSTN